MRRRMATQNPVVVVGIAIVAVVVAFVFLIAHAMRGTTALSVVASEQSEPSLVASTLDATATDQDSDGDDLRDWEEVLWNTDANNPDTDGDGIEDGVEVKRGDSPTILGSGHTANTSLQVASSTASQNATQAVARSLMTSVLMELKNKGSGLKGLDQEKAITDAVTTAQRFLTIIPITPQEVSSVPSTTENRITYALSIQKMFLGMNNTNEPETITLQRIAQGDKVEALETLQKTTESYTRYITAFKMVSVPDDAIEVHVQLVNALLAYNNSLAGVVTMNEDPVRAASALSLYVARNKDMAFALSSLKDYLDTHNMLPKMTAATTPPGLQGIQ